MRGRITFLPGITEDVARKIALSRPVRSLAESLEGLAGRGGFLIGGEAVTLGKWRAAATAACAALAGAFFLAGADAPPAAETWRLDRVDQVGGHPAKVFGHPLAIDTNIGKAVLFNGVEDALQVDVHPLAGAETFTWEVIFRPDPGGGPEQRFFHLQERDPATGRDTATRMLFERG